MNIIAVDDERLALLALEEVIQSLYPDADLHCFLAPTKALEYARAHQVDIAFLDIEMGGMSGLELAERLNAIYGKTNVVFTTSHSKYALPAFALAPSGYLLKPVTPEAVQREMGNLRHPVGLAQRHVRIQTFGHFAVFVDDKPVPFCRTKAKEILAYLVDRKGAAITRKELASVLWGDHEYTRSIQTHLQILISDLMHALEEASIKEIVIRQHGSLAIDKARVECDYYDFIQGDVKAANAFYGEYMANYSWAEFTEGTLSEMKKQMQRAR